MTEDELLKIKEHIEIHARREPQASRITEIMWKAVDELEHAAELEEEKRELLAIIQGKDTRIAQLAKRNVRLLEILQDRDNTIKELRRSVAQITEPVIDEVLEQEARNWIRHNHELVDRSDFHDENEYDYARVDDLVEVYVTAVKVHMKKEQVDK